MSGDESSERGDMKKIYILYLCLAACQINQSKLQIYTDKDNS
jgi:hypothetical protein